MLRIMKVFNGRPRLKIPLTKADKLQEVVGWGVLVGMWLMVILNYTNLPDTIPVHYNSSGIIDGYGHKSYIWILPLVAALLFIGLTILNRFPHIFNYLTTITQENALRQYTIATRMIRYVKIILTIIIGFIVFKTIKIAFGQSQELGYYFTPLIIGLIFTPLIYYIYALIRTK